MAKNYSREQIFRHVIAAKKVDCIINKAFSLVAEKKEKLDEKAIFNFIKSEYRKNNLISDKHACIVAFNENSAFPHYRQTSNKKLVENTLILIDAWAREIEKNSPYADITKIAYFGKTIPKEISNNFKVVLKARDNAISFLKKELKRGNLPYARSVDNAARQLISDAGFSENFIHSTGHSLGIRHVHGGEKLGRKSRQKINDRMLYAIEPGIYFKGSYGMRSEVDILVDGNRVVATTEMPRKIKLIKP